MQEFRAGRLCPRPGTRWQDSDFVVGTLGRAPFDVGPDPLVKKVASHLRDPVDQANSQSNFPFLGEEVGNARCHHGPEKSITGGLGDAAFFTLEHIPLFVYRE